MIRNAPHRPSKRRAARRLAVQSGTGALVELRKGAVEAIKTLACGFLEHPRNGALRRQLKNGLLSGEEFYRQVLRVAYRLLFLFVAEDRGLLPGPDGDLAARKRYEDVSTCRLRALAGEQHGSEGSGLWRALSLIFDALADAQGCAKPGVPAFSGFLWQRSSIDALAGPAGKGGQSTEHPTLLTDDDLLAAVRRLAFVEHHNSRRAVEFREIGGEELGSVYESLMEVRPTVDIAARRFELAVARGHERKATGAYYTPDSLVQCLLDSALEPVVAERVKGKTGREAAKAILEIKVCDPACGSGRFLFAAAQRMAQHLARCRSRKTPPGRAEYRQALRDVIAHCLYGVDANPMAVELCKFGLWAEASEPGKPLSSLDQRIQCGNSLLGATPAQLQRGISDKAFEPIEGDDKGKCRTLKKQNREDRCGNSHVRLPAPASAASDRFCADAWCAAFVGKRSKEFDCAITDRVFRRIQRDPTDCPQPTREEIQRLARQYRFFHWHVAFPEVFRENDGGGDSAKAETDWSGGFDVVLGNPPFVNVIEGGITAAEKKMLSALSGELGGTADLAHHFVRLSHSIAHRNGRIGLVQPKTFLNSPAAARFRERLCRERPPSLIYVPRTATFFPGASAYVCLLALGGSPECLVSDEETLDRAAWRRGTIAHANWWHSVQTILGNVEPIDSAAFVPLGGQFDVQASMTTGEAYAIKEILRDDRDGAGPKLVTTGLIDPFTCKWGRAPCRYLGSSFRWPRVSAGAKLPGDLPANLKKRLRDALRPKLLVAGLCNRIEAFLDRGGEYLGAVSTFSIFDRRDSLDSLAALADWLNSPRAASLLCADLGAASVGGGYMTIKKKSLQSLPIPIAIFADLSDSNACTNAFTRSCGEDSCVHDGFGSPAKPA
jgi:hypothetical protein